MKRCWKCKQTKEDSSFHIDRYRSDGRAGMCKDCAREANKAYWVEHTTIVVLRTQVLKIKEFIQSL